jgi:hypothetical protein
MIIRYVGSAGCGKGVMVVWLTDMWSVLGEVRVLWWYG